MKGYNNFLEKCPLCMDDVETEMHVLLEWLLFELK
jgi:hypothetical protein